MEFTEKDVKLYESAGFEVLYMNYLRCGIIARKRGWLVLVEVKGAEHPFITVRQACSFYRVAEAIITVVGNGKIELLIS
jgi:Holliday junction resolvase-like predicted endonuclease